MENDSREGIKRLEKIKKIGILSEKVDKEKITDTSVFFFFLNLTSTKKYIYEQNMFLVTTLCSFTNRYYELSFYYRV